MHLKRIQLIGFKSFVDPTTIPVLSHMNAIVGPNGCGKSNIVDAIRWVIGETSAKQLRGQSMSDVIFNGASGRKPVGKASVELIFDNSDSRITGEYAGFSEIAIRREVVRDGQSQYFINGIQARRRDVLDLFLGTGLGPRSYAIIEQGMISQLIEAKPEDLRTHFEEVAGISKYRERRRETENRIRHTQDNLDRLNDLREELDKQIRHLKRQSNAAERFQVLKQEQRLIHAQMKVLQWQTLEQRFIEKNTLLQEHTLLQEACVTKQRGIEKEIEKTRIDVTEWADQKDQVQRRYYQLGADIARLEQQIQHKQEQVRQWESEHIETGVLWSELTTQCNAYTDTTQTLTREIAELKPESQNIQQALTEANQLLSSAEAEMQAVQTNWDSFQAQSTQISNQFEVAKANIRHTEAQIQQLTTRKNDLQIQRNALPLTALSDALTPLSTQVTQLKETVSVAQIELHQLSHDIQHSRSVYQEKQATLAQAQGELQNLEAQHASLSALQQSALQDHQAELLPWLQQKSLSDKPRLCKTIRVHTGWEQAVEIVLGNDLDAISIDCIDDDLLSSLLSFNQGSVTLLDIGSPKKARLPQKTVLDIIESESHVPSWLSHIYLADSIAEALSLRKTLSDYESIITKEGLWLGNNWVHVSKTTQSDDCFLLREKRLKEIDAQIETKREQLYVLMTHQAEAKIALETLESSRDAKQQQYQQCSAQLTEIQANFSAKQSQLEALTAQRQKIEEELTQMAAQYAQSQTVLAENQDTYARCQEAQSTETARKETLMTAKLSAQMALSQARDHAQECKQRRDTITIQLSTHENQLAILQQTILSNQKQLTQLSERRDVLTTQLSEAKMPLKNWSSELQGTLDQRLQVESTLKETELTWHTHQEQLKQLELSREQYLKQLSVLREEQQQLDMARQEIAVRQTTLKEQIAETHFDFHVLKQEMPESAVLSEWEAKFADCQQKIDRLGPINLAAIDEYKTVSERKDYMDQQCNDLVEGLAVLQDAIRKIDRETRHLFRDTYDRINERFQQLFPQIFGGGQASLALTDDDLLTTGILVRAQPPGKRNATIHLLSGGEKTLTAIALMFAMFQLNPAPFCMLDEVDAPLDDLNVGRFCHLVKEMSKDTQFLVVSHNKVTIQSADHLMGVTMQEPGVSRIVSVDIQAAVEMAEA